MPKLISLDHLLPDAWPQRCQMWKTRIRSCTICSQVRSEQSVFARDSCITIKFWRAPAEVHPLNTRYMLKNQFWKKAKQPCMFVPEPAGLSSQTRVTAKLEGSWQTYCFTVFSEVRFYLNKETKPKQQTFYIAGLSALSSSEGTGQSLWQCIPCWEDSSTVSIQQFVPPEPVCSQCVGANGSMLHLQHISMKHKNTHAQVLCAGLDCFKTQS